MEYTPQIGAFVLEILSNGMYKEPFDALREYVQNSLDSIRDAEERGVISEHSGRIEVELEPEKRSLIVRDNGLGIPSSVAFQKLLDVGVSTKSLGRHAGFRGIGRLAGIAYCDTLVFRTSYAGENKCSTLAMNCSEMRQAIRPDRKNTEALQDILKKHSDYHVETCEASRHFFEVQMIGLSSAAEAFLNWQAVDAYLSQVAPVGFDAQRFIYKPTIEEWLRAHGIQLPSVTVVVTAPNVHREVYKPYRTYYKTIKAANRSGLDFHIEDVKFFPEDPKMGEVRFWCWYGVSPLFGQIDDPGAGFRIRQSNIAIGGPQLTSELFQEASPSFGRFNAYYIGEIHIVDPAVVPNNRRDGFEDGCEAWAEIKKQLVGFFRNLGKECYERSKSRNQPETKLIAVASPVIADVKQRLATGLVSKKEQASLLRTVARTVDKVESALSNPDRNGPSQTIKDIAKELTELKTKLEANKLPSLRFRSDLDKKQRKLLSSVLELVHDTLTSGQKCAAHEQCYRAILSAVLKEYGDRESE
ncbi:MAG TPA: hypothetical protein GXX29_15005 [Firmicutes bacterium]|nr:hypothetical protein [Bacillota bacterium]